MLRIRIIESLPRVKRNILTMGLCSFAKDMIEQKYQACLERVKIYAVISALAAIPPVPGLSIVADMVVLAKMASEFRTAYGLSQENIKVIYGDKILTSDIILKQIRAALQMCSQGFILELLKKYAAQTIAEEFIRYVPWVGGLLAASLSFAVTYSCGRDIAWDMRCKAISIADELSKFDIKSPTYN